MSVINIPARNEKNPFASIKGHHVAVRVPDFAAAKRWYFSLPADPWRNLIEFAQMRV